MSLIVVFCTCNEKWSAVTCQGLKTPENLVFVIATGLCLLAKGQDTLIEQFFNIALNPQCFSSLSKDWPATCQRWELFKVALNR